MWKAHASEWTWDQWVSSGILEATAVAVDWTQRGRKTWLQRERAALAAHEQMLGHHDTFDFPAFVMNLGHREDRREHSEALLGAIGFTNLIFPETVLAADINFDHAIEQGWLTRASFNGLNDRVHLRKDSAKRAYVANTIGHLSALRQALESSSDVFVVFEDDLLPTASLFQIKQALRRLLAALTSQVSHHNTGTDGLIDMLYLEYCYENCTHTPLLLLPGCRGMEGTYGCSFVRARSPICSGAIAYTRAGALRVLQQCVPIFDGIDGMLPSLILNGSLSGLNYKYVYITYIYTC